ncbi:MAG: type II toxin-antitoxin system PemK/MazF family toxin [Arcobacteraceae bacterium]|jgi:mRNA interferase MazF|nr:type II toxin-antitoxin system PemK/MazF family toxin [Arcobacteraceae bacterium]
MFKKGEIYLAQLNPKKGNEVGKLRPILIYQTNMLNEIAHPTTTILPLSTHLIDESYPLRFRVQKRDKLQATSEILCDQIRTIDNQRIIDEKLTTLSDEEMKQVNMQIMIVLGLI